MLIIQRDPFGATGRERFVWDHSASLQENIARAMPGGGADCTLTINGQAVDPLTDPRMDMPPAGSDQVVVTHRPATGIEIAYYVFVALSVVAALSTPKVPGETVVNDSPNNKLTGQTNLARTYQGIPDVYGYRRVWPDLIQPSVVEYIDNVKFVTEWLCVSRGKGTITDVQYAETPISDVDDAPPPAFFEPASGPSPYPEHNTTTLTNVLEAFETPDVNGQELPFAVTFAGPIERVGLITYVSGDSWTFRFTDSSVFEAIKALPAGTSMSVSTPVGSSGLEDFDCTFDLVGNTVAGGFVTFAMTRTAGVMPTLSAGGSYESLLYVAPAAGAPPATVVRGPFTLAAECDSIRFNLAFLRGLKGTAEIEAEWWKIDGAGAEIGGTRETAAFSFTRDSFDQHFFTRDITPAAGLGRYRIQFERTNATSADGTDVAKLEEVFALRRYATKTLPGVTVVKVTTKATQQATGFSDRKFNLRWQRHVRDLTSATLGPSRNFARAMVHLWCVAGEPLGQIDTDMLAAINTEFGADSALLRFDGTFDDAQMSLGDRLQRIADTARCILWRDGNRWTVTRDQARTVPQVQLDYRNLAAGGESVISYAAHLPASYDGVEVEYTDETTQASKAYVRLSIASGSVTTGTPTNPKKFSLPGCATTAQASNRADLEARRLLYQRVSVKDTALSDAAQLGVGSLVRWIDPNDFAGDDGLQAGEVLSIAGSLITTSEPLDWRGETTGRVIFTGVNGAPLGGGPIVCTPHSSGALQLASVPSGPYVADGVTRQLGSRYAFGPGLTETEIQNAGLYLVQEVSPASDKTVSIALAAYDARMYEAD